MNNIFQSRVRIALLTGGLILSLWSGGCRSKPLAVSAPKIGTEAQKYIAQGDSHFFQDPHLYGWRQAEASYAKAYAITVSDEIRRKLLLIRFLMLIRQIDEDIPYPSADEVIRDLCAGDSYQRNLCGIAEWIENGRKTGQLKVNSPMFSGQDPAIESYVNLVLFQATPRTDAFPMTGPPDSHKESPLFLYLNIGKLASIDPAEFENDYPQFAEGFQCKAENFFQKKKYRSAREYYQKAIELIPDYANAWVGLGNVYFYGLEDYVQALHYYEKALKQDAASPAAQFGKGMVLQQLGNYTESNATLDRMLLGNLARNKWIDGVPDAQYYQGEGSYLKAYNYYLMRDPIKARKFVDSARKFLPDAPEINYLSGVLFYESKDLDPARLDFLRVTQMGNYSCDAQLNLGFIYEQLKSTYGNQPIPGEKEPVEMKSLQYFMAAGGCMDSVVGSLSYKIKTLDSMDLDASEKAALKVRLERKLADERQSSCSTIEMLKARVSNSQAPEKAIFLKYLDEIFSRLRAQ